MVSAYIIMNIMLPPTIIPQAYAARPRSTTPSVCHRSNMWCVYSETFCTLANERDDTKGETSENRTLLVQPYATSSPPQVHSRGVSYAPDSLPTIPTPAELLALCQRGTQSPPAVTRATEEGLLTLESEQSL